MSERRNEGTVSIGEISSSIYLVYYFALRPTLMLACVAAAHLLSFRNSQLAAFACMHAHAHVHAQTVN
jgi:hypothetical protein